jgi:hypothetical protein
MATLALDTLYNFADYYAAKIKVSTLAGDSTSRIDLVFKHPTGGASFPDFTQGIRANGTAGELVIRWSKADNKIRGSRNSVEGAPADIPWLTVTGVKFQFTSNNTAAVVTAPVAQTITFALPTRQVTGDDGVVTTVPVKLIQTLDLITDSGTIAIITKSVPVELSATSTSGLTVFTFSSSDITAATITEGNVLTYLDGKKTVVITASQGGNDHWLPATATITLAPKTLKTQQTVMLSVAAVSLSIGQTTTFTASASSGLPVTVTSLDPSIVSISGNNLVGVSPGPSIIYAEQGGNNTYEPANTDGVLVVVKKTAQTVTFPTDLSAAKVGDQLQLTASSSSGLPVTFSSSDNSVAAVSEDSVLFVRSQGAADITAFQAGSDIYDAAEVTKTLTIGASDQTITFPEMAPRAFGSPAFALGAFASSNLPLTYNSSNPLVATVSSEGSVFIHKVGTTFITVNQAGNTFWTPAASVQRLFTVTKAKQTISFSNVPSQINISEKGLLKGTSSSGGAVTFFVSGAALKLTEESGNFYITGTAEGQGTVTATAAGDVNYEAVSVDFDVAVGRQSQEIMFPPIEPRTFNFRSFSLTASATSGLPVSFSSSVPTVASVSASGTVTVNKVGVTTITASQAGDAEWNAATSLQRFLVVDKAEQQISFFPPAPVPSTTASIALSASAPGGAVVFKSSNSQVVEINGSVAVIRGVGAARIVATQAGSGDYMPAVAVVPIFVVPVIDSVATPSNSITDQEPHASTAVSPSTSAVAVVMGAPLTLDREEHNSLSISPALNLGDVVPPNTVLDQSAFSSREVSTIFTGTSQTLSGGSDHESYLAGVSPAFLGTPVTVGAVIEEDLSSYASYVASVADHAASECVRAKYDGRDSFEVYLASLPSAPEGYLLIRGGAYLLWGRTSEGGVFTGRIVI